MNVYPIKFVAVFLMGAFLVSLAPTVQAQKNDKAKRPQRRAAPAPRPQNRPAPRPRAQPRPTPRAQPRPTPRPTPRSTPRSSPRPTPSSNPRNTGRRSPASNPRARSATPRRPSTKRVPSVKRYQDTPSRSKTSNRPSRRTSTKNPRSRTARTPSTRSGGDSRTATTDRSNTRARSNDRNRRNNSKRSSTANTSPRNRADATKPKSDNKRDGLTVTPLKRSGGLGTRQGSGRRASSGFGSNQPGSKARVPTSREGTANRNNPASTRRPAFRKKPLPNKRTSAANRGNNRKSATKKALGRGGVAVSDGGVLRKNRNAKTLKRRPSGLSRSASDRRGNVVEKLSPVPKRRLKPRADANANVRRDNRSEGGRSGAIRSGFRRSGTRGRGRNLNRQSNLNFGLFAGGNRWGFGLGYSNHNYFNNGGSSLNFGFGGGNCYSGSYLHGAGYSNYWRSHYYGYRPYHLGIASPAHVYYGHQIDFRYRSRLHFGYNYYHPFAVNTPYPFYRTCYYEPWYVNHYARRTPIYRTYYYVQDPILETTYVETADPFVDEDEVFGIDQIDAINYDDGFVADVIAPIARNPVPVAFQSSFSNDVPDGQSYDEGLAWAEEALFNGDYNGAAEAFRRAMKLRWEDDYPKFQLALALFGAERYDLAHLALELGLNQNPAWLYRRFDVRDAFESREEFASCLSALERYLIRHSNNDEARFVLGYCYFFSGNLFGARSVTRILDDSPRSFPHLKTLSTESEKRLLREGR